MNNATQFAVTSCNFSWHQAIECPSYDAAVAAAKARGFEARIEFGGVLVAVWSPLYGVHVYSRNLAGQS